MGFRSYSKSYLSFKDQVELLVDRGLIVEDKEKAVNFLSYANYYRFSAYVLPFESSRHHFVAGTKFSDILALYNFDRELSNIVSSGLETVEIQARTKLAYILASKFGSFAHIRPDIFSGSFDWDSWHDNVVSETKRSKETFVTHFREMYREFPDMPIWATTEIMSFGSLSKLFQGLKKKHQKTIADDYGVAAIVLQSWLHTLTYLRNICAHHSRLWNRQLSIKPKIPNSGTWCELAGISQGKIFFSLMIIRYLLSLSVRGSSDYYSWGNALITLVNDAPKVVDIGIAMGIPDKWERLECWNCV